MAKSLNFIGNVGLLDTAFMQIDRMSKSKLLLERIYIFLFISQIYGLHQRGVSVCHLIRANVQSLLHIM